MHVPEIVLLGGPNSGKTHYAGQLYGRLQRNPGSLKLRQESGPPKDLSALEEVLRSLEDGHAAGHTPTETWSEILLPLVDGEGNQLDLRWPDYGGEQLKQVFENREVAESWRSRLAKADGWILLIRLQSEKTYPDALEKLVNRTGKKVEAVTKSRDWDANAYWVELLQILLHAAELGTVSRIGTPRLVVLLSCYDELNPQEMAPRELLAKHLPLVSSFLESNWQSDALTIWGLSALGCPLDGKSENDEFIDNGPETQGWVVPPLGNETNSDLTEPLAWLLECQ
jgi:hypothetical protein